MTYHTGKLKMGLILTHGLSPHKTLGILTKVFYTNFGVPSLKKLITYRTDKLIISGHTHTDNENTHRPKLASGKNVSTWNFS